MPWVPSINTRYRGARGEPRLNVIFPFSHETLLTWLDSRSKQEKFELKGKLYAEAIFHTHTHPRALTHTHTHALLCTHHYSQDNVFFSHVFHSINTIHKHAAAAALVTSSNINELINLIHLFLSSHIFTICSLLLFSKVFKHLIQESHTQI